MLLPLACLKRYFLKVLQRLSEFVQHYQSLKSSPSCHWQNRVFRPSIQQSLTYFFLAMDVGVKGSHIFPNYFLQSQDQHYELLFQHDSFYLGIHMLYINTVIINTRQLVRQNIRFSTSDSSLKCIHSLTALAESHQGGTKVMKNRPYVFFLDYQNVNSKSIVFEIKLVLRVIILYFLMFLTN